MPQSSKRILVYSHDSFGLGHLRRCQTIANSLAAAMSNVSVLILTGSSIVGSFEFHPRVDFMRLPGILKRPGGDYVSSNLDMTIEETAALRSAMIRTAAEEFDPDLFLVDKEPLGLRGEVEATLELLKRRGVPAILGLRDVMDDQELLAAEWRRKNAVAALDEYYNEIWVYGPRRFYDPLAGLALPQAVRHKMVFTGYLRRMAQHLQKMSPPRLPFGENGYILVTAGGGGDGAELFDWVLRAYEYDTDIPYPAYIVFGPFLEADHQRAFFERAARLERVAATDFEAGLEQLMKGAVGVVAMGGYNTFCEILSLDKRALIVPRTKPRLEQYIRAARAQELGLSQMLVDDGRREPRGMAEALRRLPTQARPSNSMMPGLLDGIENLTRRAERRLARGRKQTVVTLAAHRA
jgi:predicted glycosyltransferase